MQNLTRAGRRRKFLLPAVLVVGALAAAACGSDNKSSSGATTTAASGGATTTAASGGATTTAGLGRSDDDRRFGGATTTASGATGAAKAKEVVDKTLQRPTSIDLNTPVGKDIPTGKKLYFISCGVESCALEADIIKQAADILGWSFTPLQTDGSSQQIQNAWEQVVREKPDGVVYTGTRAVCDRPVHHPGGRQRHRRRRRAVSPTSRRTA